jgi:preprotein translocase subunit Sss1
MTPPRLSAIDALARGFANVRANRELIAVQVVSGLLLAASIVVPVLFFLVRLGVPLRVFRVREPEAMAQALAAVQPDFAQLASMLGLGLLVMLVVGMLVFILYCWFQAGTLAVLLAGEAQAPVMRMAPSAVFRTFSWAGFVGWASRYGLRIFWINNLFLMLLTLLMFVFALPFLASAWLSSEEEFSAVGCVVGCGLAVPLGFVALVLVLAMMVAQICAVQEGATTLGATRRAFSIAGRRLGGLLLLYLLMIVGSIAITIFFGAAGLVLNLALARAEMLLTVLSAGLGVVEFVASVCLTLVMTAAIVALVRAEMRAGPAPTRPSA